MPAARLTLLVSAGALLAACVDPPPPRSIDEFLHNPIMLEAALVRCAQNRSEMRYEAECVNAREANKQLAAREEAERREEFEKQFERKRQALRHAQEAAAMARQRAEEERRRQEEAEQAAQFGQLPPDAGPDDEDVAGGNEPIAVIPAAPRSTPVDAPSVVVEEPSDLDAVREELKRRNDD